MSISNLTEPISLRLTPGLDTRLRSLAQATGRNVAQVTRAALHYGLEIIEADEKEHRARIRSQLDAYEREIRGHEGGKS